MITTPEEFLTAVADYKAELLLAYNQALEDEKEHKTLIPYKDKYKQTTSWAPPIFITPTDTRVDFNDGQLLDEVMEQYEELKEENNQDPRSDGHYTIRATAYPYDDDEAEIESIYFAYNYNFVTKNIKDESWDLYAKKQIKANLEKQIATEAGKYAVALQCEIMSLWIAGSIDFKTLKTITLGNCNV